MTAKEQFEAARKERETAAKELDRLRSERGDYIEQAERSRQKGETIDRYGRGGHRDRVRSQFAVRESEIFDDRARSYEAEERRLEADVERKTRDLVSLRMQVDREEAQKRQEKEADRRMRDADRAARIAESEAKVYSGVTNAGVELAALVQGAPLGDEQLLGDLTKGEQLERIQNLNGALAEATAAKDDALVRNILGEMQSIGVEVASQVPVAMTMGDRANSVVSKLSGSLQSLDQLRAGTEARASVEAPARDPNAPVGQATMGQALPAAPASQSPGVQSFLQGLGATEAGAQDPLMGKIQGIREMLQRRAQGPEVFRPNEGESLGEGLQRVAGSGESGGRPLSDIFTARPGESVIYQRGVTPPTETIPAEGAHVPRDIRESESFREGRFFTNIGTPGGGIRRVLPPAPAGATPSEPLPTGANRQTGPIEPGSYITHEDIADARRIAPQLTDEQAQGGPIASVRDLDPRATPSAFAPREQAQEPDDFDVDPELASSPDFQKAIRERPENEALAIARQMQADMERRRREEEEARRAQTAQGY